MPRKRRYFKQLRLAQFRAMIELSRHNGFAAAAASLDLATPSVWQQLRALEDEFNVTLVDVNGQQVTLTEHGRLLVELAEPVVQGFDSIVDQFTQRSQSIHQRLVVASPANILVNELPSPIRRYRRKYEDVELSLIDLPSNPARQLLEDREADLAVVGQLETTFPATLQADPITTFPFMLVCPPDHPIVSMKRPGPKSLARFPLVMSNVGTNTRARVDQIFDRAGLRDQLRIACETSTKDLLLQYVEMGFGITIVPISPLYYDKAASSDGPSRQLAFRDMSGIFGHEQIVILRRRHRREPPHQKAFRDIVLDSIHPE
ncbi:MAG: LysR family transcriptional regulator [Planctomycetota bacterium]